MAECINISLFKSKYKTLLINSQEKLNEAIKIIENIKNEN
jgi:hypothetical protein